MRRLTEVSLGVDGIVYVESSLRAGTGLCARVLQLPISQGEAFAALPEHTDLERAKGFQVGGLLTRRETDAWFSEHVRAFWENGRPGTLVLQDIWAKPGDPAVQAPLVKRFYQDSGVYYFVEREDADLYSIRRALRAVVSYLLIGVFTRFSVRYAELPPNRAVGADLIEEIGRATQEVFVSAYDQEGFVVWRR